MAAIVLAVSTLAASWPGVAMYDSVWQYQQALEGRYNDWHPPVMAHLWALLLPLGGGAAPMFVLQVLAYWGGLALLAAALARVGRVRSAVAVLAIGAFPLALGWQVTVLKDAQMAGAMLLAVGLLARWRLAGRRVPAAVLAAAAVLLGYAVLVRSNALFAVVPLVVMLSPRPARWVGKISAGAIGLVVVLLLSPTINHHALGAEPSAVAHAQPIYDLVGIAQHTDGVPGLRPTERDLVVARHCYTPLFWDPLGDARHCGALAMRLDALPIGVLARDWLAAIAAHPLAYATHRLAHLNSTERLIVPFSWFGAAPPSASEPNEIGLDDPGPAGLLLARAGGVAAETPFGWPIVWVVVAASVLIAAARQPKTPSRDLAVALAVSALTLEASFAVISIASDLRYHLWAMIASALAGVLVVEAPVSRRTWQASGIALAVVVTIGIAARAILPLPPLGYEAMLG